MTERVSYWLLPTEADGEELGYVMCDIAGWIIDAPSFDPHVTVYSSPLASTDDVTAIVESVARGTNEIALRSLGIAHSEEFTKTLFIEFVENDVLSRLHDDLRNQSSQPGKYELKPHLSLAYANVSADIREYFAREINGPRSTGFVPATIHFDRLRAVAIGGPVRSTADVEAWRTLAEARLGTAKD